VKLIGKITLKEVSSKCCVKTVIIGCRDYNFLKIIIKETFCI